MKNKYSPSKSFALWGKRIVKSIEKGLAEGERIVSEKLANSPKIGDTYFFLTYNGNSHDLLSGQVEKEIWKGSKFDEFRCIFGSIYPTRLDCLKAKFNRRAER